MKGFIKFSIFLISSNLLIAFAAMAQSFLSYVFFHIPVNYHVLLLEWSATLLLYNLSLGLSMPKELNNSPYFRTQWYFRNRPLFWTFNLLASIGTFYAILHLHWHTFLLLGIIGLMSLGYAIPFFKIKGKIIALRQVMGLKVFLIAIVWSLSTVGMPAVEYYSMTGDMNWTVAIYWGILVALFILAITLPFDIRDIKQDTLYDLRTIPILLGETYAKLLCCLFIILHIILLFYFIGFTPIVYSLLAIDLIILALFKLYLFTNKANYESVYILDFMLIAQCVLASLFVYV